MKIVYYTDQTYLHGGIERVLANKVNYLLSNTDHEIYLVTTEQRGKTHCYGMDDRLMHIDLKVNYERKKSYFHPVNLLKAPAHYLRLKKILKDINPDVLVVCNYAIDFFFIPFLNKRILKIKEYHSSRYFYTIKRNNSGSIINKKFHELTDFIEKKYDALVILNKIEQQYYRSDNTVVIPNSFTNYPDETSFLNNKTAISAGRIAPVKQFDKLIEAWSLVVEKRKDWILKIYGSGEKEYIQMLQDKIDDLNLNENLILCGETDKLDEKMRESSLYLMSSQTECFPMVLLEAMANGLPIVSFKSPHGPESIVTNNQNGILVDYNDISKLSTAILTLIDNGDLMIKLGENARNDVRRFLPKKVMELWISLFENRIKSKRYA